MAKATTTIKQVLNYQEEHAAWFAANQVLFNQVAAFYFEVIQAHEQVLDLSTKEALTALEKLTHTTKKNPHPVKPLFVKCISTTVRNPSRSTGRACETASAT